jgi:hypothetical protein
VVNLADFHSFYANYGTGTGWTQGDFDLDGQVTFTDYQILQRNWGKSDGVSSPAAAPLPAFAEVPEPGALALIGLGGAWALSRRGRRRVA